jgi:hypothetical protein
VDLDTLAAELLAIVDQTTEPIRVSLCFDPLHPVPQAYPQGLGKVRARLIGDGRGEWAQVDEEAGTGFTVIVR